MEHEDLKKAINEGISGVAVKDTLEGIANKSEELGTPKQVVDVVDTLVELKSDVQSTPDNKYSSDLVKNNSEKIKSAINDGISSNEIATTLVKQTSEATNTRKINFIVRLIEKIKRKEYKLNKNKDRGYQKQLTNK